MSIFRSEDYVELETEEGAGSGPAGGSRKKTPIEIDKISEYADSDRLQRKVRDGSILLVSIKELKDKNMPELKRALERIKRTVEAIGGDIVGAGDDWVIISPGTARIVR